MEIDSVEALQAELHLLRQENRRLRTSLPEPNPHALEKQTFEPLFERDARSIVEGLGEGIFLTDLDGWIVYVNDRVAELTAYTAAELIGRPAHLRLFPQVRWTSLWNSSQESSHGSRERYELEMIRKDGSRIVSEIRAMPWRDAQGQVIGMIGAITDVTDRCRALAALEQSEARYRRIFERNDAVHLLIDPLTLQISDANGAACDFYGYSLETLRGMKISAINTLPAGDINAEVRRAVDGSRNVFSFRHRVASGVVKDVEVYSGPIEIDNRTCLYSIVQDVTERKRLQDQLLLSRKLESVARLAGGIAHDFNNLLTAIIGYTGLAQTETPAGSDMDVFHKNIQKAAERASEITHQLLAFAQRTMLEPRDLDLRVLISQKEPMLRRLLRDDIELVIAPSRDLKEIYADPMMIEQLLSKLVENGRDALPSGGRIVISATDVVISEAEARKNVDRAAGEYVEIVVEDNGVGMSEEIKPHVFDPFFTTRPQGHGAGLGLAMCYGMVTQSGGTIKVESAENVGTRFIVLLPVARDCDSNPAKTMDDIALLPQPSTESKKTILVVDDESLIRNSMVRGLRQEGYNVLEAGHGREALRVAGSFQGVIDLLVTDVIMPRMGGKELVAHLQKLRPETRVLYTSGFTDNPIVRRGIIEQGFAFIQKPFTPEALTQRLQEMLLDQDSPAP